MTEASEYVFPASFAQCGHWFLHQLHPDSPFYNVPIAFLLTGPLDIAAMVRAFDAILERHELLRTVFRLESGGPVQIVSESVHPESRIQVIDLSGRTFDEADRRGRELIAEGITEPFDLSRGPVIRARLVRVTETDHRFLIVMHHIVTDIPSCDVLIREFADTYGRLCRGKVHDPVALELQYGDYAVWQRNTFQEHRFEPHLTYWREQLRPPIPFLGLLTDRPRPVVQTYRGTSLSVSIAAEIGTPFINFCKHRHVTLFSAALAAYVVLLYRQTGQTDLLIGTPISNRSMRELEALIGLFLNTVVLRIAVTPDEPFAELLARVQQTVLDALNHEMPFEKLVEELKPARDLSRSPFFQTMLTVQHGGEQSVALPNIEVAPLTEMTWKTSKFDLTIFLNESNGSLTIGAEYNTDLFDSATIESILNGLILLFDAVVHDPDRSIASFKPFATASLAASDETVAQLMQRLETMGLSLFLDLESGRLKVNAPKGLVDDTIKAIITAHRTEIVNVLQSRRTAGLARGTLQRIARTPPLPLSAIQRRLWFVDRFEQERGGNNVGVVLRLEGMADLHALSDALEYVVERHESLRMRIGERNDEPYLEIIPTSQSLVMVEDVTDKPEGERETKSLELAREAINAKFDLARGPVARFLLIRTAPDRHLVAMNMHHIVADGWSLSIALKEFAARYSALTCGTELNIADLPLQYVDYAAWEGEQVRGGLFDRQLTYWKAKLASAPTLLELPTDRSRPPMQSFEGHRVERFIESDLVDDIARYSRRRDVTPFMTILAALQVLLHRISGQDDFVIGTPAANRGAPELENVIGPFVNSLALRANLAENPAFNEFLIQVRQVTIDAIDNRDVPFDLVVEAVNPRRAIDHAPIFQVMFALHNFPRQEPRVGQLNCTAVAMETRTARLDLTIDMMMYQNQLLAIYEYATDLFNRDTIERLHDNLIRLVREVNKDDTRRLQDLPLLSSNDERILLDVWNSTEVAYDRGRCTHGLFESAVRMTPDARALIVGSETYTYRQIDERANRLAHLLRSNVVAGDRVAICLDRGVDMPVAMAAVLKAGAAYVPLDPTHPSERLRYTLEDAQTACVITHRRFATLFAETDSLILLDEEDLDRFEATSPEVAVRPEDLAYIIYTSGSTGRPKGVQIEHRNLVSFLEAMRREPGLVAADVLLAVTTLAFDIAGLEFWLPFSVGASVVIASREDALVGERLIALLDENEVTVMQATPSTWRLMLEAGWVGKPDLKALCGGETLPRDMATKLAGRVYQLWNMYGPTETTIWSTISLVTDPSATIPIGRPIANTRVYVLERSGLLAPIGALGELAIAGDGVARGYWNRPELTAEKFLILSLPDERVERVYRTGDVVRFRNDGQLEFYGRCDHQVKLRGYRIELGEIELILAGHPSVKQCVVTIREDDSDPQLVGYVVQSTGMVFDPDSARSTLRSKLPGYMVPSRFVVLPALPLTPNKKIDRKALPAPENTIASITTDGAESLMTPVQQRIADIWRSILRIDRVSLHDNFFDIGGHSMLIVKLHGALQREFDSDLTLIELFQRTTVASQSERVSSAVVSELAIHRAQARARKRLHG